MRSAKLAYVSAKKFRVGRGSDVLPRIYPFVRLLASPRDTSAFANLLDLKISFTKGITHMPVAESLAVFHNEIIIELIPIRRPATRKKKEVHDRVLLEAMGLVS